jgi:hypothetical protein
MKIGAPLDLVRPVVRLGAITFVIGFVGYVAIVHPKAAVAPAASQVDSASGPASDDWNLPKHI